jgi:cytochrome c
MKHVLIPAIMLVLAGPAVASADLAKSKSCLACHAVDKKLVGPALRDVARRYAGTPNAEAVLARRIQAGGGGKWGPMPMPAQKNVSDKEAQDLARWILQQK